MKISYTNFYIRSNYSNRAVIHVNHTKIFLHEKFLRENKVNYSKTQMHAVIGLKFGTFTGLIKADLSTNFGRNPMNIHGFMTDYLCKIRSKPIG